MKIEALLYEKSFRESRTPDCIIDILCIFFQCYISATIDMYSNKLP